MEGRILDVLAIFTIGIEPIDSKALCEIVRDGDEYSMKP
jgi:hypothetical protein